MAKGGRIIPFSEGSRNEALRRIREAASSSQTTLNLSDLALDSLPRELETLQGLQRLLLGTSRPVSVGGRLTMVQATFTDLSPVAALTNLQSLDLSGAIRLQDVSPLSSLVKLQELQLNHCVSVTDLAPLANLSALAHLSLPYCKKVQHLEPLADLRLPYLETGVRLIKHIDLESFQAQMERFQQELRNAVQELDQHFEELKRAARERLGQLFDLPARSLRQYDVLRREIADELMSVQHTIDSLLIDRPRRQLLRQPPAKG